MARLADLEARIAQVEKMAMANKPLSGINTNVSDAQGGQGRVIDASFTAGGVTGGLIGPWCPVTGTSNTNKVAISKNRPILNSLTLNDVTTITDIDNEFTIGVGDLIYLKIDYDPDGTITEVTLTGGAPYASYSLPYDTTGAGTIEDPLVIVSSYYLLAYGATLDDTVALAAEGIVVDGVRVVRCCYSPLRIDEVNTGDGFVILYPLPPSAPGPA